jgi:hypothetical protein
VMMYNPGAAWDIRPFTELTLRIVEPAPPHGPTDQTSPVR